MRRRPSAARSSHGARAGAACTLPIVVVVVYCVNGDESLSAGAASRRSWYSAGDPRPPGSRRDFLTSARGRARFDGDLARDRGVARALWARRRLAAGAAVARRDHLHADRPARGRVRASALLPAARRAAHRARRRRDRDRPRRVQLGLRDGGDPGALATLTDHARAGGRRPRRHPLAGLPPVTLPLLLPAILVAVLLIFSFSFDDVITSLFLGGTECRDAARAAARADPPARHARGQRDRRARDADHADHLCAAPRRLTTVRGRDRRARNPPSARKPKT